MENTAPFFVSGLVSGYASTIVLDLIGLRRRGLLGNAWVLILTPLHWLLLSLAAWRALFQLIRDPQRWEKTEHGMASTSRVAGSRALLKRQRSTAPHRPRGARIGPGMPMAPIGIMDGARKRPLSQ